METMTGEQAKDVSEVFHLFGTLLIMLAGLWLIFRIKTLFFLLVLFGVVSIVVGAL